MCLYDSQKLKFILFSKNIYLFEFGCAGASLLHGLVCIWGKQELIFVAPCRLLIAVASLVAEHRL